MPSIIVENSSIIFPEKIALTQTFPVAIPEISEKFLRSLEEIIEEKSE